MKDEATAGEGFLSRWNRRKQEAKATPAPVAERPPESLPPAVVEEKPADFPPPPDLATIDASTDLTPWLRKSFVPEAWKTEALRKMWAAAPEVRNFRGLQDYDWDFNNLDSIPGFAEKLDPGLSKQLLAHIFGDRPEEQAVAAVQQPDGDAKGETPVAAMEPLPDEPLRLTDAPLPAEDAVMAAAIAEPVPAAQEEQPRRIARRGGGALPAA
jgi:hypothetical protein